MSTRVETLIRDYPQMVVEKRCLTEQLANFRGLSATEVIESMYSPCVDGERVQTSGTSDKTAQIAMNYRERMERINREWFEGLEQQLHALNEELSFFEAALRSLPDGMSEVMNDLVKTQLTWDAIAAKHHMSRANVGKIRKRCIAIMETLYAAHDQQTAAYLLS